MLLAVLSRRGRAGQGRGPGVLRTAFPSSRACNHVIYILFVVIAGDLAIIMIADELPMSGKLLSSV